MFAGDDHIEIFHEDSINDLNYKKKLSEADMTDLHSLTTGILLHSEEDVRKFKSKRRLKELLKRCQKKAAKDDQLHKTMVRPATVRGVLSTSN